MFQCVRAALRRIQEDLAHVLDANQITDVCREVGYCFRKRLLDPITTIQLFVVQILNGNFAVARLQDFSDDQFMWRRISPAPIPPGRIRRRLSRGTLLVSATMSGARSSRAVRSSSIGWT